MMTAIGYGDSDPDRNCTNQQVVSDSTVILLLMHQEPLQ